MKQYAKKSFRKKFKRYNKFKRKVKKQGLHFRKINFDYTIFQSGGLASFSGASQVNALELSSAIFGDEEFGLARRSFMYFRINGVKLTYTPLALAQVPFYAIVDLGGHNATSSLLTTAQDTDGHLQCTSKATNLENYKYFPAEKEIFVCYDLTNINRSNIIGGGIWNSTSIGSATRLGSVYLGQQISGTADNYGVLTVTVYMSFCKPTTVNTVA